jgi:hypothetical protein
MLIVEQRRCQTGAAPAIKHTETASHRNKSVVFAVVMQQNYHGEFGRVGSADGGESILA